MVHCVPHIRYGMGEIINKADPHVWFLHRATEKLAENKPYNQSIIWTD